MKADLKLWIPFSVVGMGALFFWFYGAGNVFMMFASRQWPSVTGSVILSKIERDSGIYRTSAPSKKAVIVYQYRVNDSLYTSDRVLWGGETFHYGFSEPDRLIRTYPAGQSVTVYYDPDNPARSVLERRARLLDYGLVGFCSFVLFLQIYFLVYLWRKKQYK